MEMKISDQRKLELRRSVQAFYLDQFDETIGELKAEFLIDFFIDHLGCDIYNQAIKDAGAYLQEKAIFMEDELYIPKKDKS
ncbi:MAG: DUF2164 domain-containing protein [Candidatus Neomarinimicrobiota bacterium]